MKKWLEMALVVVVVLLVVKFVQPLKTFLLG
jgi:hypothetical protein